MPLRRFRHAASSGLKLHSETFHIAGNGSEQKLRFDDANTQKIIQLCVFSVAAAFTQIYADNVRKNLLCWCSIHNSLKTELRSWLEESKIAPHEQIFSTGFQKSRILTDKTAWRGLCIALNYLYNPLWVSFRNRYPPLFVLYLVTTPADRRSLITTNRTRGRPGAAATLRVAGSRTPSLFVYHRVRAQTTLQTDILINRNGDADAGTYFRANMWEASDPLGLQTPQITANVVWHLKWKQCWRRALCLWDQCEKKQPSRRLTWVTAFRMKGQVWCV